jgi:hypothetical protein
VATPESVLAANYAAAQASGQVVSLGDEEGAPGEKEAADGADAVDAGSKRKHTDGESDEWSNNIGGGVVTVKREKVDEIGDAATATATAEATQGNEEENDDVGEDDDDDDEEEDLDAPPLMPFVSAFANCGPSSQVLPRLSRSSSKQLDALLSSEHEGSATRYNRVLDFKSLFKYASHGLLLAFLNSRHSFSLFAFSLALIF